MQSDDESVRNAESCVLGQAERHMEETSERECGQCRDCKWFRSSPSMLSYNCYWMFNKYGICTNDPDLPGIVSADDEFDYCFEERGC